MSGISRKKTLWDYDTIIFDFDGVILDSMEIKANGLRRLLEGYPEDAVEALVDYHLENGGVSRYYKIRYFFEELLGEEITQEEVYSMADEFSEAMKIELNDRSYLIEDTVEFIENNHEEFNLHIASGADEGELKFICNEMDLAHFFITIQGSPIPKEELVKDILEEYGYEKEKTILIGDSKNDYEAAKANGISFAGFNNEDLLNYPEFYIETFYDEVPHERTDQE